MPRGSRSATRRWHASTSRATSSTRSGTTPSLQAPHNTRHEALIYPGLFSRATAFDVILGIMLGSMVSRAIAGTAPFLPTLAASSTLLAVHWLFSAGAVIDRRALSRCTALELTEARVRGALRTLEEVGFIDRAW